MDKSEDDGCPQLGQEELKKLEEEADLCGGKTTRNGSFHSS